MRTESEIIHAIQRAGSLAEQASLVAELDALKAHKARTASLDSDIDLGDTIVQAVMTPVRVHEHHTASTDWLSDVTMTTEADLRTATNAMAAEASLWFARVSDDVKADREEFSEQARGMARRLAGKYDEQAPAAAQAFLDYADFLHRRTAASGLDQVQQITAPDGVTQKATPLPQDVFDTFNQPVADVNVGIDEMQTTESAPLLNEIIQNGQGEGQAEVPGGHSDTQVFTGPNTDGTGNPVGQFTGSLVDAPSVALGYTMNLDDFRRQAAAEDASEPRPFSVEASARCVREGCEREQAFEKGEDANDKGLCVQHARQDARDNDKKSYYKDLNEKAKANYNLHNSSRTVVSRVVTAASGLPQVQQIEDAQENIDPTPLPQDVMFPLVGPFTDQMNTGGTGEARSEGHPPEPTSGDGPKRMGSVNPASDNPLLGETFNGSEGSVEEPTNAMQKAVKAGSKDDKDFACKNCGKTDTAHKKGGDGCDKYVSKVFTKDSVRKTAKEGSAEFRKGFAFAANWTPEMPLVKKGSAEFEAGLFAGMRENEEAAQVAWTSRHEARGGAFARRIAMARKFAATSTDLETMDAGTNPAPNGNTPINGPGTPPPLEGGMDAAAPGGASPYNGAAPFGQPVAPDPLLPVGIPQPGNPSLAFRQTVQAGLLRELQAQK